MLVSVHLPKTAGSSFFAELNRHFDNQVVNDVADLPLHKPAWQRRANALKHRWFAAPTVDIACIHGHFLPYKYAGAENATFITWLRDPIDRLISHYYYWQQTYTPEVAPLHRRVVEENWTLDDFCLSTEMRNIYSEFLWRFPLSRFAFVGITECYEEDLAYFFRVHLGSEPGQFRVNVTDESGESGKPQQPLTEAARARVDTFHARDREIYEAAVSGRNQRSE